MSDLPPELAHLSAEQIIAHAKRLRVARERVKRDADAAAEAKRKQLEAQVALSQTELFPQYKDDPVGFAVNILGITPWSRQAEMLRSVVANRRTAVRSGHKTGKSSGLAIAALWWVKTRRRGRVIATATKAEQIRDIFWREVRALWQRARDRGRPLGGQLYETAYLGLKYADGREIIGKTSKAEGGAPGVGGYSGPEMFFIIDEASGVPDDVLEAFKGNLAGGGKLLVGGNPLVTSGWFYDAFTSKAAMWHRLKISSEETPNVSGLEEPVPGLADKEYVDEMRRECGPEYMNDPVYQTRVAGEFPGQAPNAVVGLSLVDRATQAWASTEEIGVLEVGVDVAREGDDESAVCMRRGLKTYPVVAFKNQDSDTLAANVRALLFGRAGDVARGMVRRHPDGRPAEKPKVKVDSIGVGAGVYDRLKGYSDLEVYAVNVAEAPTSKPGEGQVGYDKLRDQLWFAARDYLRAGGTVPPESTRLLSDLVAPKYSFNSQGEYKVEPKKDTKKRLKRSPDHGDAFCLCVYQPPPKPVVEIGRVTFGRR